MYQASGYCPEAMTRPISRGAGFVVSWATCPFEAAAQRTGISSVLISPTAPKVCAIGGSAAQPKEYVDIEELGRTDFASDVSTLQDRSKFRKIDV